MSRVKETGGNQAPQSAAAAAMENRLARKCAQMEAGQVLIEEASRHAAEVKEELLKERDSRKQEWEQENERDRTEEKRDTPELSRQSKWFGIEGKLLKDANITWTLEMEQELWEAFQKWMPVGDQNLSAQLDELSKLYHLKIDEVKSLEDTKVKKDQMSEEAKDRYFKLGIAAADLIIPLVFYGTWMKKGFKFEETGTFTSTTFRSLFSRFKPTKK